MLHHLAFKVGDVTAATQMVWVVVELHLLVCIAFLEVILCSSRQSSCLRSLQAAVIAAEALAIDIVVVVLAMVRHCKGCIIILDSLQLLDIFLLIVNRKSICLATSILDAAWVRTVRVEVTNLGNYTLTTDIDVLSVASALVSNEVRRYIK